MKTALVVGLGSAGSRHARLLEARGVRVGAVTRNTGCGYPIFDNVDAALGALQPDLVVVSNTTAEHRATLERLADCGYAGTVLVEKPLADQPLPPRAWPFARLLVAYNLRFHPVIQALRQALAGERTISAQIYVGQYLPSWRPGRDYRQAYSARRDAGGGVLRDLSHELDYAIWCFGPWRRITAIGGHYSSLEIDSDDAWAVLMELERCPLTSIQLNYLDRVPRREIIVNTDGHSYRADLVNAALWRDGVRSDYAVERDTTYALQLDAILQGSFGDLCTAEEGARLVDLIGRIEGAAAGGCWVTR